MRMVELPLAVVRSSTPEVTLPTPSVTILPTRPIVPFESFPFTANAYWPFKAPAPKTIDTVAEADCEESAQEVAVTVTDPPEGGRSGAVYKPLEVMVPILASPPLVPFTLQSTQPLVEPSTLATNCWVAPLTTVAAAGETVTSAAATIVTVADAPAWLSAFDTAVRVTVAGFGTEDGAV